MMSNLSIITGASRGIGRATAQLFVGKQWDVINLSRKPCDLSNVTNFTVDLSQRGWEENIKSDLQNLLTSATTISLIHNAAVSDNDSIDTINGDDLRRVMEINLIAPVILNQLILPYMKAGSSIIYIGSTLSEIAVKGKASYVTTKHGLVGLMRSTCQDLVGRGISTACICPGFTNTEMLQDHVNHDENIINDR